MAKNIVLMEFEGNPNIGIYMFANDKFCLLGYRVDPKKKKEIENVLGVPVIEALVLDTQLLGVFIAGNNDFLLIPELFEREMDFFTKLTKKYEMELITVKSRLNTVGNNVCVGNKKLLVNPDYMKDTLLELNKKTGYDVVKIGNSEFKSVGALCVFKNSKYFISQEYDDLDLKQIKKEISGIGSINSGSAFVGSGIVGNSKGLILGSLSSTIEIQNVVETLDYL